MDELLAALLSVIFDIIFDGILLFGLQLIADVISRILSGIWKIPVLTGSVLAATVYFLLGLLAGGFSLVFFPHPLVHPSKFHGISLLISPTIAGLMMWWLGSILRKRNKKVTRIESFGYGFVFAFGVALVRFFYTN